MKMKKILTAALAAALLGGCAGDGNMGLLGGLGGGFGSGGGFGGGNQNMAGIGSSVLKTVIDGQCRTELNNRNEWRMIALSMSAERQRQWEDRICSCVSEDALNQVSVADLTSMLDTNSRNQAVAKITARTVTSCVKRIYRP
jgi:hypothetical protein